jgi:hypothetical protein
MNMEANLDPNALLPEGNLTGPDFWIPDYEGALRFAEGLKKAEVWEFGRSAGNRPLVAIAYGAMAGCLDLPLGCQSMRRAFALWMIRAGSFER